MVYGSDGLLLERCTLVNNSAPGQLTEGGAISIGGMGQFKPYQPVIMLKSTTMLYGTASLGGAISIMGGLVKVEAHNSTFTGNRRVRAQVTSQLVSAQLHWYSMLTCALDGARMVQLNGQQMHGQKRRISRNLQTLHVWLMSTF